MKPESGSSTLHRLDSSRRPCRRSNCQVIFPLRHSQPQSQKEESSSAAVTESSRARLSGSDTWVITRSKLSNAVCLPVRAFSALDTNLDFERRCRVWRNENI